MVVGGGWIGLEVAAAARAAGCEVSVLVRDPLPLLGVLGPELAAMFADLHRENGVDLRTRTEVSEIVAAGDGTHVGAVELADGTLVDADLVVVGIGAAPRVDLAEAAGLHVEDGVVVDAHLRSSNPHVLAVGDIARAHHPFLGTHVRVEHWANALNQPATAAATIVGRRRALRQAARTSSPTSSTSAWSTSGTSAPHGYDEVVVRGDLQGRELIAFWRREGRVLAGMNVNVWDVVDDVQALIRSRARDRPRPAGRPGRAAGGPPLAARASGRPRGGPPRRRRRPRARQPSCWIAPLPRRSTVATWRSTHSRSPASASAGRTWSTSWATTSAAGSGSPDSGLTRSPVSPDRARPPGRGPQQLGARLRHRLARGRLGEPAHERGLQRGVVGVQAHVRDAHLDRRVPRREPGVEVDHPLVEDRPRAQQVVDDRAVAGGVAERRGRPRRRPAPHTCDRYDAYPVVLPCQDGLLPDRASSTAFHGRRWSRMRTPSSSSAIETCTWHPHVSWSRAVWPNSARMA